MVNPRSLISDLSTATCSVICCQRDGYLKIEANVLFSTRRFPKESQSEITTYSLDLSSCSIASSIVENADSRSQEITEMEVIRLNSAPRVLFVSASIILCCGSMRSESGTLSNTASNWSESEKILSRCGSASTIPQNRLANTTK